MSVPPPPHAVRALIDGGLPVAPVAEQTVALTRYFHRLLSLRTPAANDAMVTTFHAVADRSLARSRPPHAFACARGCSSCCSNHVTILPPEAFALARQVRGVRYTALHARLGEHVAAQARLDLPDRRAADIGCAFLVERACSAYAARPLVCRMFNSFDLRACLVSAAGGPAAIPQWSDHATLRSLLGVIMFAAMRGAGLRLAGFELNRTVAALIADPGLEAAWFRGDAVFEAHDRDALSPDVLRSADAFAAAAGLPAGRA